MPPREPDLTKLAKKLTSKQMACTEEIKLLMDCMMRQGLLDADAGCQRQTTAAMLCLQTSTKASSARAELGRRLQSMAKLFKRYGYR